MTNAPTTRNGYILNAAADMPDIRDQMFQPSLGEVADRMEPDINALQILDQGREGACTGFGLAAAINLQRRLKYGNGVENVSARMLYEMAKRYDEWTGEDYDGSSIRGALRGFYNNGVCTNSKWPYVHNRPGTLTLERARDARNVALGAYYRVRPDMTEMHAALNEAGVVYASAKVHDGWFRAAGGVITPKPLHPGGGHAFAIVGYTDAGFIVQNSWNETWGRGGVALWQYSDWARSITDVWVMRIGVPTPTAFDVRSRSGFGLSGAKTERSKAPRRTDIAGHFAHLDDGQFHESGRYHSELADVRETMKYVRDHADEYPRLLLYAHGGLNAPKASASRIAAMKDTFKANGVYPFHFMYDTGLGEELKDVIVGKFYKANERAGFIFDGTDWVIEKLAKGVGTSLWEQMKDGADKAFRSNGAGTKILKEIAKHLHGTGVEVHIVAHSLGSVLMGHLLNRAAQLNDWKLPIKSLTLFAPACRTEFFEDMYRPRMRGAASRPARIGSLQIQNLTDQREQDDNVAKVYRKSLLYLVSNAFERPLGAPLLGMQKFADRVNLNGVEMVYAGKSGERRSDSSSHGGFDNDPQSMNTALKRVLGNLPVKRPFTKDSLEF